MSARKVKQLSIDIPMHIIYLSGNIYFDSKTSVRIHVNDLVKYITGKPEEVKPKKTSTAKKVQEIKDLDVMERRWDLNTKDYAD